MKKLKTSKNLILLLLLCLPTTLLFSILMPSVAAKEFVPTMHPKNQWFWHDDIFPGEKIMYEETTVVQNFTTGELITQYKMFSIYNITGFQNTTLDGTGFYPYWGDTSAVLGTQLYYNCTSHELLTYNMTELYGNTGFGDEIPFAMLGYNNTHDFEHYIGMYQSVVPLILPINGTSGLEVDKLAGIINSTYFTFYADTGNLNAFDFYSSYVPNNEMSFSSNDGYYMDISFYDNGTIKDFDGSFLMQMGPDPKDKIIINSTCTRVFRYDYLLDDVEWSFNVGDRFYFGDNNRWHNGGSGTDPEFHYDELEIKIVEMGNETVPVMGGFGNKYFQCYSYVLANISVWNSATWLYEPMTDEPIIMGMANKLCPANMMEIMGGEMEYFEDRNLQVITNLTLYDFTVQSHPNNQSWKGAEISVLDGYNGIETGERYEILDAVPFFGNIRITVDKPHTLNNGSYIDIRPMPFERPEFVFYPINTDPKDVEFVTYPVINHMMEYDNFYSFSDGSYVMNHSTYNDEMRGKYNIATGIFEWGWSKDDMGQTRSVQFRKSHTYKTIPLNEISLYPIDVTFPELGTTQVFVNYTWGSSTDVYSAVLPFNPVLEPFFPEINSMPLYFDLYTTYSTMISNIYIRIEYDENLLGSFDENYLTPYGFDMGEHRWEPCPDALFTVYPTQDEIVIFLPSFMPNVTYYAIGAGKEWDWGVDMGDTMTFLCQGEVYGNMGPMPYNDFSTFNITSIANFTHYSEPYSQINTTSMYYHPSIMDLVPTGQVQTMGEFGIRQGDGQLQMWLNRMSWGIPAIVPLRYGSLDLQEVGRALRDFFVSEGGSMGFPTFDGWIVSGNNLHMSLAGDVYYLDLTYYDNGTLDEWDVFSTVYDQGYLTMFQFEGNHESDVNPIDDISWGVSNGDIFYFGSPLKGKIKVEITLVGDNFIRNMGMDDLHLSIQNSSMAFSHVLADIYKWDDFNLTWILVNSSYPIAAANEHFLFTMDSPNLLLLPFGVTGWDVYESFSPFMHIMGFDSIVEVGNDYLRLGTTTTSSSGSATTTSSDESPFLDWYFDSNTGVTELFVGRARMGPDPEDLDIFGLYQMTYNDILLPSTQIFDFSNPIIPGFKATANITTTGTMELLYALISGNMPTSATIGNGTIMFFSDILVPDPANITSMIFTFEFPSPYNPLAEFESYQFWIWDESLGHPDFRELSAAEIAGAIVGKTSSTLLINFTALDLEGSINIIFAITKAAPADLLVPGYDVILLLGAIGLGSVVIYLKKRRKL